ncbi:MAG: dipeptidase PepE [Ginsengibacter sp.]
MPLKRILAFSSSRSGDSGYLESALPHINDFLGEEKLTIAFIPFASVDNYEEYYNKVTEAMKSLPHQINLVLPENAKDLLNDCDSILVGGGNTFKLLYDLYELDLVDLIRQKINEGIGYIGWSAGSNILGASISTTNDMPIVEPKSFAALNVFPFLINPHYFNQDTPGFNGETRDMRLEEFLKMNPDLSVFALPEGSALRQENLYLEYLENGPGYIFKMFNGQILKQVTLSQTNINYLLGDLR